MFNIYDHILNAYEIMDEIKPLTYNNPTQPNPTQPNPNKILINSVKAAYDI